MRKAKGLFLVGLICACLVPLSGSPAAAATKIRIGTVALPETTIHKGLVKWQQLVKEKSNGSLAIAILDRGVMGGDREMIEACRLGTLDSAVVSGSVLANLVPQFFMIPLPYLFNDHAEVNAYLDGPLGAKLFGLLESKDLVGLGWATWSFRGVWNNVRPIVKPDDIKGLKVRTVETPLDMSTMNSMGGVATPMAWNECLLGLRQGTVDGISTTYGLGYALKLYDIAKFATQTKHYYETAPLIMGKKFFDGFTPRERKLLKDSAAEAMRWARLEQAKVDDTIAPLLEKKGVKVNAISEETFEAFRARTRPVYAQFEDKIGKDFMEESMKAIEAYRKKR